MTEPSGLYSKLAEVSQAVGYVPKRGRNEFHKYDYVTEADLVDAVRDELSKRQIVLIPSAESVVRDGSVTTVQMTFTFADGETGETHTASWAGTGEDPPVKGKDGKEPALGDKGLYKAYTGAIKYFLMKSFLIPTGDDPERDDPKARNSHNNTQPAPKNLVSVAWANDARQRIKYQGVDHGEVRMKLTSLNVGKLEELSEKEAALFDAWLSSKADAQVIDEAANA